MNLTNDTQISLLQKVKNASWGIMLFLLTITTFQTCSTSRKLNALNKTLKELKTVSVNRGEIDTLLQIEGLRSSKRMLYDNNAIIRTTIRPDDRMNQYDLEIKRLQGK